MVSLTCTNFQGIFHHYFIQTNDDDATFQVISNVPVGPDGVVDWPNGNNGVDIGVVVIIPTEATSEVDEYYVFKVEVITCKAPMGKE